jgi:hypothetical protein
VNERPHVWSNGTLQNRRLYEAWSSYLFRGLKDPTFLTRYQGLSDVWQKSREVGSRISELSEGFKKLTDEEKDQLAADCEAELKAGLQIMNAEKKALREMISLAADPPAAH